MKTYGLGTGLSASRSGGNVFDERLGASLDAAEKRRILPLPGIEPRRPTHSPSLEMLEVV